MKNVIFLNIYVEELQNLRLYYIRLRIDIYEHVRLDIVVKLYFQRYKYREMHFMQLLYKYMNRHYNCVIIYISNKLKSNVTFLDI